MKNVYLLLLAGLCLTTATAQQPAFNKDANGLYDLSVEHFQKQEYALCHRSLDFLLAEELLAADPAQEEHARFMTGACAFFLNRADASLLLKDFLLRYPLSVYAPNTYFYLGTLAMNARQYRDALESFLLCDKKSLTKKEYEDYRFRLGYCYLQAEDFAKSREYLSALKQEQGRYILPATYYLAYLDYVEGHHQEALDGFRKVADIEEYRLSASLYTIQLLFKMERYTEMLELCEQKLREDLDEGQKRELYRISASAFYEMGDYTSALDHFKVFLQYQPQLDREDAYRIGMTYFLQQRYAEAVPYFAKATEKDDAIAQNATYHLGVCYLQMQKTDMARMSFERASLSDHDLATKESALYNYALLCYQTSFSPFNEQVKAFERILTEFPQSRYADRIYSHLADAFLSTSNYQASIDFINKIERPAPNIVQTKVRLLFLLGREYFLNADFTSAYRHFNESVELGKKIRVSVAEACFWRAETAYRLGRLSDASADYTYYMSLKEARSLKSYPTAHYNLAYCYFNSKDYASALTWFTKYILFTELKGNASYADALNRMGDCHYFDHRYAKAEECYQRCDALSPHGNDYAVYQQAFCMGLRQENTQKAELLQAFESRFPQSDYLPQALFEEGRAQVAAGKVPSAIETFKRLKNTFPSGVLSRKAGLQMGLLYYQSGQYEASVAAYKEVVDKHPGSDEAKTAINDLKSIYVAMNRVSDYADYLRGLGPAYALQANQQDSLSYKAANHLMAQQRHEEAIAAFQSYLNQYPQGAFLCEAGYYCASLLRREGRLTEAIPYYKVVLQRSGNPFLPDALSVLAEYAYTGEQYEEALGYYRQWENTGPDRQSLTKARIGSLRCLATLERDSEVLPAADLLLTDQNLSPEILSEVQYDKAMALLKLNREGEAEPYFTALSTQVQTARGAEARYRLADYRYRSGQSDKALELAQSFLREGSPHSYWVARCFLLLSDIYMDRGDDFQARQYLLSLRENYPDNDDIPSMIQSRLNRIEERASMQ